MCRWAPLEIGQFCRSSGELISPNTLTVQPATMPIPDLADRVLFPPMRSLPADDMSMSTATATATPAVAPAPPHGHCLLAEVQDNMTITKPTLVLNDRDGQSFALIFDGLGRDGLDLAKMGLRKGATAVVRGARQVIPLPRTDPADESLTAKAARRPFIRIAPGEAHTVQAVAAPLEQTVAAAARARQRAEAGDSGRRCDACGATSTTAEGAPAEGAPATARLLKCTGCGQAWYCSKVRSARLPSFLLFFFC